MFWMMWKTRYIPEIYLEETSDVLSHVVKKFKDITLRCEKCILHY